MYKIYDFKKINKRNKKIRKIISIIFYILIIPILIIDLVLVAKSALYPDDTPSFLGYKNFIIVSESMEPNIMVGDAVFVKEVQENQIKINDIISFNDSDGDITTHRVIEIIEENGKKLYKTKGDNNKVEDKEKIEYKDIEGKYQFHIKGFGIFANIIKSRITLIILIILLILNVLINRKNIKKSQARSEKRKRYDNQIFE
jgi:signal peptidase